jgi:hypothetical protein
MRKLLLLILVLVLSLGLVCAQAEQNQFLVSDWMLLYTYGDSAIAEQTLFIYEDNTFEVMNEAESKKGTWTFDGETLVLSLEGEAISLRWNEELHQFSGEYNGMTLTMYMSVQSESETQPTENGMGKGSETGMIAGGWSVAEDQAITDEINNAFWQAMDSYQTGTITVAYTPVALLATQVVAGTNYAVLCKASEINKGTTWVIVYLYQDLQGTASVLSIEGLTLGV